MSLLNELEYVPISIASPYKILEQSYGEVTKPETINYKTFKPEKDGLFCERVFGPSKDWHCAMWCGQYKKVRHKGKVCEKCGVEVTTSKVRRERMGHIELAAPIAHFWYLQRAQGYVSTILDIPYKKLESIIYCKTHLVIDAGDTDLEERQLLSGREYEEKLYEFGNRFRAGIGASVIKELLEALDLDVLANDLEKEIAETKTLKKVKLLKRLKVVDSFRRSGNRPEWMILDMLPVIPPDLRPMVQLDGGRFATIDLNDLYRRIINRNNRLKKLIRVNAPDIIIQNEVRMLQEAVDALIANHRRTNKVIGPGRRVLKSLSSSLEGKQGRFRQNLLGKRVDFSGRSVITVGPELKLHQCGIPRDMALELFRPFIENQLVEQGHVKTVANARQKIESRNDVVWDVLEQVVEGHPVLLNRAPTLHKLSIRAFEILIIEGEAIKLHPLVCSAFNADFDGDQMAVHVPLSREAQAEARILLLASENLLHPQNGESAVTPSQDIVLGCHYLLIEEDGAKGEGKIFGTEEEVLTAYEHGNVALHSKIILYVKNHPKFSEGKYLVTTVGKILFNRVLPTKITYLNEAVMTEGSQVVGLFSSIEEASDFVSSKPPVSMGKDFLKNLISMAFDRIGAESTAAMLDGIKDVGYKYATRGGLTIGLYDINIPKQKSVLVKQTEKEIDVIENYCNYGQISDEDRYQAVIELWTKTNTLVTQEAMSELREQKMNPIRMMIDSGARGAPGQYGQLAGMRGLMADPTGKTIERPIKANFQEGLSVFEFFISTHGARKGLADTSLKTADSGYLTRRMVDVAQNMVITEDDCETTDFMNVMEIKPQIESLEDRIVGRFVGKDILDDSGEVYVKRNTFITEDIAKDLSLKYSEVPIRNLLTCMTAKGVCRKCYGLNLSTRKVVDVGEAVGVIAAQSIGEPGTQLTMRTFHTGGVAGDDITQGLPRIQEIFEARSLDGPKSKKATLSQVEGVVEIKEKGRLKDVLVRREDGEVEVYNIPYGHPLAVSEGETVKKGDALTTISINPHELLQLKGMRYVQTYLLQEIQKVYATQGVKINDKHIEIIVRQMSRRVVVETQGGSKKLIPGRLVDRYDLNELNKRLAKEKKEPVTAIDKLQGITEASKSSESFLSSASFQETAKALTDAAVKGKRDYIRGLKESVITGKKIPAGTGFKEYLKKD
jgi:DNA-directed RNA polymerase subunit beta'